MFSSQSRVIRIAGLLVFILAIGGLVPACGGGGGAAAGAIVGAVVGAAIGDSLDDDCYDCCYDCDPYYLEASDADYGERW